MENHCCKSQEESLERKLNVDSVDLVKSYVSHDEFPGNYPDPLEEVKEAARLQEYLLVNSERLAIYLEANSMGDGLRLGGLMHIDEGLAEELTPQNRFPIIKAKSLSYPDESISSQQEYSERLGAAGMAAGHLENEQNWLRRDVIDHDSLNHRDGSIESLREELKQNPSFNGSSDNLENQADQHKPLAQLRLQDPDLYQYAHRALVLERVDIEQQLRRMKQSEATCASIRQLQRELWLVIGQLEHDIDSNLLESVCKKFAKEDRVPGGYRISDLI